MPGHLAMNGFNRSNDSSSNNINRRNFLGRAATGAATALGVGSGLLGNWSPTSGAGQGGAFWNQAAAGAAEKTDPLKPDTLFLTWRTDPTTSMTVQWVGADFDPNHAAVSFAPFGGGSAQLLVPTKCDYPLGNFKLFRSELTGLKPGTEYQFHIGDGKTPYRFRTMPAKATDSFSFISGGDCGVNRTRGRQQRCRRQARPDVRIDRRRSWRTTMAVASIPTCSSCATTVRTWSTARGG